MRRHHAISPGFSGHYQDLRIPSRKRHDSACKLILSVGALQCDHIHANTARLRISVFVVNSRIFISEIYRVVGVEPGECELSPAVLGGIDFHQATPRFTYAKNATAAWNLPIPSAKIMR